MFDLRTVLPNFYCQHMPSYNKPHQIPVAFMSFEIIHSMFLDQTAKICDIVKPPTNQLTYEKVIQQLETLKYNFKEERERTLWGDIHLCEIKNLLLSLRWRLFLKCLPENSSLWTSVINEERKKYEDLCINYSNELIYLSNSNPLDSYSNEANLIAPDPNESVGIDTEKVKVSWDIKKDIRRTKLEKKFQTCENRQMLHRILFLFAIKHPELNYTQGMNELIAVIFNITIIDYSKISKLLEQQKNVQTDTLLRQLFSPQYLEHDVYCLFEHLMDIVNIWYESTENHSNTILFRCEQIAEILRVKDPHIYQMFSALGVEPQLFLLRWVRILFCQMFNTNELYYIWDILFAHNNPLSLLNYLCVVLMLLPRSKICSGDGVNVFNIFFNYPNDFSIYFITHCAIITEKEKDRPIFEVLFPIQTFKKDKRKTKSPSLQQIQKELTFNTSNTLDTDSMYMQLAFIEDSLEKAMEFLPSSSKERQLVSQGLKEVIKMKIDVKLAQTFPKRRDY
ncbi:Rab GTPase activating protein, putative [Entamoeba histolytica HM-1:IMSS-B]|uniref:Rab GTPase activating protein, putative n=6 Tax=Entamoeba histolytica TaxID=5759 RepID=C4LU29_ENTH1|nr:Rab GTPase activating protein, putative [Entamoeba histolytica HM-1:IMSS]EMD42979.1 Rab GTPase activating protein, putative [Entamoeba histolytica KU27]EMH73781.1 Rab GTPase activating protein, putative [Entamoeba histolytica HM-1:IMSS-B]EMS13449.1 Rab GTPase activating protein, putative [Entamoeba histolytica HM-3:IMSS]ENY60872.1 Rab GTPase activating protein, putative [Entamoeba histolytica HM-1:IMSS-A]GAT92097.1 Rab GTPase activating protein putative [Entamoeba histolytica]|eukprot:XP_654147.1 Rab GTPase activating protein, putative [Entamoeba histolytica HM-1:IMSS]